VFDEGGVKAGCLDVVLGGRDPQRAGPHPDVLSMRITPLRQPEQLAGPDCRADQVIPLSELPDPGAWITTIGRSCDRPERVTGVHTVGALGPTGTRIADKERPRGHGDDCDEKKATEHLFV
jgi:hypothetical protein